MKFVLSLIASPVNNPLGVETLAKLSEVIDVAEADRLADEAYDIPLAARSAGEADDIKERARQLLENVPVDVNVMACEKRRKRLLLADMDSTIIHQECIDELGVVAGVGEKIQEVTRRAMRGELDFVEALNERVTYLKGLPESVIREVIDNRITFVSGGREMVQTMKAGSAYCALISGGFAQFTSHVAEVCGFDANQANQLVIADGVLTGRVVEPALGAAAKVEALKRLAAEKGLSPDDAVTVGDGANDIGMIRLSGLGVAMHAKPAVREAADTVIDHGDLTAILYLQGYRRNEFAS